MSKKLKPSLVQRFTPANQEEEKRKFFFDSRYNPQFEYHTEISDEDWEKYGPISDAYLEISKKILDGVIRKWESEENYQVQTRGKLLTQAQVQSEIEQYLKDNQLEGKVIISFSTKQTARTLMKKNKLIIRLPVQYREHGLIGMLNHEIGTHFFRRLNDEQQPWHNNRRDFGFDQNYLETEEGLATINTSISLTDRYLFGPAIAYYSVFLASQLSFADTFKQLRPYVEDKEKRWSYCLKVKRGLKDTSQPGAFSKNQVYLSGAIRVLRWMIKHDFALEYLYLGKISLDDISRAKLASTIGKPRTPQLVDDRVAYKEAVREIIAVNKLDNIIKG